MASLIELRDVARYYQMGDERIAALDGVSFAIEAGEMVAIVGSSGSGKSTLLNILGCLDTPSRGQYRLAGHDVQDLSDDERAGVRTRQIGFVFQSFQLLHRASALGNVALPLVYRGIPARERHRRAAGHAAPFVASYATSLPLPSDVTLPSNTRIARGQRAAISGS